MYTVNIPSIQYRKLFVNLYNVNMNSKIDTITYKVGVKIRIERMKKGLSQEKLAELSNIGTNSISSIERGVQSPTVETVAAIAKALDIELYKLFIFDI